jgi:gas vesicle protein
MFNPKSRFSWGVVVGAVLGGAAAYFLSPRTGRENREMAKKRLEELREKMKESDIEKMSKDIFGKVTEEGKRLYAEARTELNARLDDFKAKAEDVDYAKYRVVVDEVVERLSAEKDATQERLKKLQEYLLSRWDKVEEMAEEDVKKTDEKKKLK